MIAGNGPDRALRPIPTERSFALPLPVLVRGRDAANREFTSPAELVSLSAVEARLRLRLSVRPGDSLSVTVAVPKTAFLETPIRLDVRGTVSRISADPSIRRNGLLVLVRLDPSFRISALSA